MTPIPFSTFNLSEADAQKHFDIYSVLKNTYNAEVDPDFSINIRDFSIFNGNEFHSHGGVFRMVKNARPFYVEFIDISYDAGRGYRCSIEYQTWGIINLKNSFGHVLIKPETFLERIHDLINPIDVNFEDDAEFSEKFLVVTDDKVKAQMQMTKSFRDCIMQIQLKEFMIEIVGNKLIIGDKKVVSLESTLEFAKYLNKIADMY